MLSKFISLKSYCDHLLSPWSKADQCQVQATEDTSNPNATIYLK